MSINRNIRLYISSKLTEATSCELSADKSHYLNNVMRCKEGEFIYCFNEKDGEFLSEITKSDKKRTVIMPKKQTKAVTKETDLWLLFAPLKKDNTDFVIEKATELGVSKIVPVITRFTNCEKVKVERFVSQAIEASEQCERLSVPQVENAKRLRDVLDAWDNKRTLFFMNERRGLTPIVQAFYDNKQNNAAILIGPEGGFSDEEVNFIESKPFVKSVTMGPRILRAETAAVSALSVWQACVGDWNQNEVKN